MIECVNNESQGMWKEAVVKALLELFTRSGCGDHVKPHSG